MCVAGRSEWTSLAFPFDLCESYSTLGNQTPIDGDNSAKIRRPEVFIDREKRLNFIVRRR